jgi:hypothetical protein
LGEGLSPAAMRKRQDAKTMIKSTDIEQMDLLFMFSLVFLEI